MVQHITKVKSHCSKEQAKVLGQELHHRGNELANSIALWARPTHEMDKIEAYVLKQRTTATSTATPTPPTKTPSLHPGLQPPLGSTSQPDQVCADSIAAVIEFEEEYSVMGFDGLFDSVFGEI